MTKSCDNLLGTRALAVISCALALLAVQPTGGGAATAKVAKVQMMVAFELQPMEQQEVTIDPPSYRIVAMTSEMGLSQEQKFAIEQHLLAPPTV